MDDVTIVLVTLSINIGYQILHYFIRKISDYENINFLCCKFSKTNNESSIKYKRSSETDKDGIHSIEIK